MYSERVPKLWEETIDAHRRQVRDAIVDAAAELVQGNGRRSVTMSQIAERAGIGRATLYKYFADIEAILHAWHARQIDGHLRQLAEIRERDGDPGERLRSVLDAYALMTHQNRKHHDIELMTFLHQDEQVVHAQRQLHGLVAELIAEGVRSGSLRMDVTPDEMATYCLHALSAAPVLPSEAAVRRLVRLTLAGMRSE
jgi:AcrR family transcriptional regulator